MYIPVGKPNKVAIRCHASSFSSSEKLVVVSQRADSLCTASIKLVELNNDIVQFNENTKDTFTMT